MSSIDELKLRLESNDINSMFDIVINILMKYSNNLYNSENFEKIFNPYILCRYISMKDSLIPIAEYLSTINSTTKLSKINFYKLAFALIPKQNKSFISYIKKKNNNQNNKNIEVDINNNSNLKSSLFDL